MATEKIICDTDVLIDFFDHAQPRHAETKTVLEQYIGIDNVLISSITKMELILGATNKLDLLAIEKKLNRLNTVLLTPDYKFTGNSVTSIVPAQPWSGLSRRFNCGHSDGNRLETIHL
jgi:hypothetical protein